MAEDDEISSREAILRAALGRIGLALHTSGGGYQVVDASTLKPVAGAKGPGGYSMSLKGAEDFTVMASWAHGNADRRGQLAQAVEMAGWDPDSPHPGLPDGTGIVLSDSLRPEPERRYETVETMGPRTKAMINAVALRERLLEKCEHLSGDEDFVFWISTQPARELRGACWQAAQQADEPYCAFCNGPADEPVRGWYDRHKGNRETRRCYLPVLPLCGSGPHGWR